MEHRDCFSKLSAYLDKELEAEERRRMELHFANCFECKIELECLKKIKQAVNALPIEKRSVGFDAKMHQLIANERIVLNKKQQEQKPKSTLPETGKSIWSSNAIKVGLSLVAASFVLAIGLRLLWQPERFGPVIIASRGLAQVYSQKQAKWIPAKPGLNISKNDQLRLAAYAQVDIEAKEYYSIRVKENSEILFIQLAGKSNKTTMLNVKSGNLFIKTEPGFKGSDMYIKTPSAKATVIGTAFVLQVNPEQNLTWLGVLKGAVAIEGVGEIENTLNRVVVSSGEKTTIKRGDPPALPEFLSDKEWQLMDELYHIGELPQVALLIGTSSKRVEELMAPCMLYVYDKEPRTLPKEFEDVVVNITEAVRKNDMSLHERAANRLRDLIKKYPNPKYNVQFLLFLGAYYNYLDAYEQSISCFEEMVKDFPDSNLVSLALCAEAIVYHKSLKDKEKAVQLYRNILDLYKNSPEAEHAKGAISNLT